MGNCCGTTSSSSVDHWGGEDWSFLTSSKNSRNRSSTKVFDELKLMNNKEDKLLVGDSNASSSNGKIKIKISKKELQVLLGELEKQNKNKKKNTNNSAEQVLVRLMEARDQHHHLHRARHNWSPVLESIPEVN